MSDSNWRRFSNWASGKEPESRETPTETLSVISEPELTPEPEPELAPEPSKVKSKLVAKIATAKKAAKKKVGKKKK